jgi:transposase
LRYTIAFLAQKKKHPVNKCYKSLGSLEHHIMCGLKDPIAHFQKEVDALNLERAATKKEKISSKSKLIHLGYFPLASILSKLQIKGYVDILKLTTDFKFDLYALVSSLIFARAICPCSKNKTFHEVLPSLYSEYDYSYDQLLAGLDFIGNDYEKFIELFTKQVSKIYGINSNKVYFDCTNFYFEIDREDEFRRKGPSKENRKDPIVGMGLLLDSNQIPIAMKLYPGNESEKPVLRETINQLRRNHDIKGKIVHVADKGLNCAQNIAFSKQNGDGYLFSKTVKGLSEKEKTWVTMNDLMPIYDDKGHVLYKYKSCVDEFPYTIFHEGKNITVAITEKRLLTYNPTLAKKQRAEIKIKSQFL